MSTAQQPKPQSLAEPDYAKPPAQKTALPWWRSNIDHNLHEPFRKLLEEYSGIPRDQQLAHVYDIREKAWAIRSYPIFGNGAFLVSYIDQSPAYPQTLDVLKRGGIYLELGCSMGVDIRRLVHDGVPSDNFVGIDIADQSELGYEMFRDKDRLKAKFLTMDLLKMDEVLRTEPGGDFAKLNLLGKADVVNISAVFHQWGREQQVAAIKQIVLFTKPGTLVVGYLIGTQKPGDFTLANVGVTTHKHNAASFEALWQETCRSTTSKWSCHARSLKWEDLSWDPKDVKNWMPEGDSPLEFVMTRLDNAKVLNVEVLLPDTRLRS